VTTNGSVRGPDLAEVAGRFGSLLRSAGVPVTPERSGRFAATLQLASPATTDELYWVGRVTLLSDHAHLEIYDRVFAQVFGGLVDWADSRGDTTTPPPPPVSSRPGESRPPSASDEPGATSTQPSPVPMSGEGGGDDGRDVVLAAVSEQERLRSRDFSTLTPEELAALRAMFREVALAPPLRRVRRDRRHPSGARLDLRATLARAHRTAGDPVITVRRRRRVRPRRLVLLCDISGSMEPYARAYLQLLHSAVGGADAEAFVFATRLTRLTRALAVRSPDLALRQAAAAAPDWSGGTRIGRALQVFNDRYGRRGMARGAVVVIVSDGWERDAPELLGREVARLSRLAHRVVWVNPRSASPRFEPLVGGMAAALPYLDALVSGHSLAALDEVLDAIAGR
jgi:uncharacterized protein